MKDRVYKPNPSRFVTGKYTTTASHFQLLSWCLEISRRGILPYMDYNGMCVITRVSLVADLAILVINRVWFSHSSLDTGMFLGSHFFIITEKTINKRPFTNYVYTNLTLVEIGTYYNAGKKHGFKGQVMNK